MRVLWISIFMLFLVSCAGKAPSTLEVPSIKDFQVPDNLANQFDVKDSAPISSAPPLSDSEKKAEKQNKKIKGSNADKMKKSAAFENKLQVIASVPNRWTMPPLFRAGERTLLDITYFGATAGQLELNVLPSKVISNRPSFHFRGTATSTSVFSLFYRVNDVAESFMDTEGLFSHKYSLKLDESRQQRDVLELYDTPKKKAYYWSKWEQKDKAVANEKSEIDLVPFTQDGLSAFFYVRTLPLAVGKVFEFPVVNNGKLRVVRVTVLREEKLATKIGEFSAFVLKPEVVLDGILQNSGDSYLWISNDAQRMILKMDAKIKVGSVIAYLREHSYGDTSNP